jgi:predicted DNA binding CopG/RHH family protein
MFVYNLPPVNTILLTKASLFFYGDKMEQVNFKLNKSLLNKMDAKIDETGINRSKYIRRLIKKDVKL